MFTFSRRKSICCKPLSNLTNPVQSTNRLPHTVERSYRPCGVTFCTSYRYPNWNYISLDKQWIMRETPAMSAQKIAFVDLLHRRRLQTLLSVDDSIARIFHTLQSLGIEDETYIFFTSDHGYHLGQFGQVKGKSMPFESDIRVPFYVRGPIIPKNIRWDTTLCFTLITVFCNQS